MVSCFIVLPFDCTAQGQGAIVQARQVQHDKAQANARVCSGGLKLVSGVQMIVADAISCLSACHQKSNSESGGFSSVNSPEGSLKSPGNGE